MRTGFLFSVAIGTAGVAACGSSGKETAARFTAQRDVALPAQAPAVEIASPLELKNLRPHQPAHRSQRPRPTARTNLRAVPARLAPTSVLAIPAVTRVPSAEPIAVRAGVSARANDRELPPGKTVTVIPTSSGPSIEAEPDEMPLSPGRTMGRSGGKCRGRGRGPGIGIAAAPRPDFR